MFFSLIRSHIVVVFDFVVLFFVEPSTEIIGAPDLYIESGSTINLTCVVHNSPEPPAFIFWNHNNAVSIMHKMNFSPSANLRKI